VSLEIWDAPEQLYLARGDEVNQYRPLFTGDVFADVAVPGVQAEGMAIVLAHPCSMRAHGASLQPRILMAAVGRSDRIGKSAWTTGHFGLMPLPDLLRADELCVARLDEIGLAATGTLRLDQRSACLSPFGINLLQQRFIWRLTRHEVPTHELQKASAHVLEEADLLEEWCEAVCSGGMSPEEAAAAFEVFLRADRGASESYQAQLRDAQLRPGVRKACRAEARRLSETLR